VKKLIQWLKAANQNAKLRAQLILTAQERMACMDEYWRREAVSNDAVALLLMRIGLAHVEAVYQGQMMARFNDHRLEAYTTGGQAHLN
jgi:nitrate reductase beta subunit